MGTRSTVKFIKTYTDTDDKKVERTICSVYSQYDGYMSGMGQDLAEFLVDIEVVNGISLGKDSSNTANGMGCLAAQFIQNIKSGVGGIYMTDPEDSQDYDYEVIGGFNEDMSPIQPSIRVTSYGEKIFEGTPQELLDFNLKQE